MTVISGRQKRKKKKRKKEEKKGRISVTVADEVRLSLLLAQWRSDFLFIFSYGIKTEYNNCCRRNMFNSAKTVLYETECTADCKKLMSIFSILKQMGWKIT